MHTICTRLVSIKSTLALDIGLCGVVVITYEYSTRYISRSKHVSINVVHISVVDYVCIVALRLGTDSAFWVFRHAGACLRNVRTQ